MSDSLVVPDDLLDFPGAPFTDSITDAASEAVRAAAGWHISPPRTETLKVRVEGAKLLLPTLNVTAVTAVRDVSDPANPVTVATSDYDWDTFGVVTLNCYSWSPWSRGGTFEVDLTHGYDAPPADVIAAVARQAQNFSVDHTYQQAGPFTLSAPAAISVSCSLPASM